MKRWSAVPPATGRILRIAFQLDIGRNVVEDLGDGRAFSVLVVEAQRFAFETSDVVTGLVAFVAIDGRTYPLPFSLEGVPS